MSDEPGFVDATTQAEMVRNGEVTPLELVDSAIERVERLNPALNAVITPMYDEAREAASRPIPDGPFSGVPFLVKDFLAEYAGVRFTESSNFIGDFVPDEDTELVRRWKRAGVDRHRKDEPAGDGDRRHDRAGQVRAHAQSVEHDANAGGLQRRRGRGGRLRHGADGPRKRRRGLHPHTGGMLRRVRPQADAGTDPLGPHFGDMLSGLVAEHALTRTVRDSAALLDATAGPAAGDPYWALPQRRPYVGEVSADPESSASPFRSPRCLGTRCIRTA